MHRSSVIMHLCDAFHPVRVLGVAGCFLFAFFLISCSGKKKTAEDDALDATELEEEAVLADEDTLVYEVPDAPLPETVDESFVDFLYTFLHRKGFMLQRASYPEAVYNHDVAEEKGLSSGKAVSSAVDVSEQDYYILLMDANEDPYDYLDRRVEHAELHEVFLGKGDVRSLVFDRKDGEWFLTAIRHHAHVSPRDFVPFYAEFARDTTFQERHLAEEIRFSLPEDEVEETDGVEGIIEDEQWLAFAPELPTETMLILDLGLHGVSSHALKFVKCGISTSMMEVLTFEKREGQWMLTGYAEN